MILERLASRENFRKVEEEWQYEFIYYVLSSIGIPEDILDGCFPEAGVEEFTVEHRVELRKYMRRPTQDKDLGTYNNSEKIRQWTHTFLLQGSYPLPWPGLYATGMAQLVRGSSNMKFERLYRYNYISTSFQAGVSYEF